MRVKGQRSNSYDMASKLPCLETNLNGSQHLKIIGS